MGVIYTKTIFKFFKIKTLLISKKTCPSTFLTCLSRIYDEVKRGYEYVQLVNFRL